MIFIALGLGMAFVLELIALVGFASFPLLFQLPSIAYVIIISLLFVGLAAFWGRFMAPKSAHRFNSTAYFASKTLIYSVAAFVIWQLVNHILGELFVILALVDEFILHKHGGLLLSTHDKRPDQRVK